MASTHAPPKTEESAQHPDYVTSSEKALTQPMAVIPSGFDDGFARVASVSGNTYTVDLEERTCECPASLYRDLVCKHLMRAAIETADGLGDVRGIDLPSESGDEEAF